MTRKLKRASLVIGLVILPLDAFATGGLDCRIEDKNLDFAYEALFNYSGISPLFQDRLTFRSKHPDTAKSLAKLDVTTFRRIQEWFEGKDLRLQFYAETEGENVPFAAIKLTIETVMGEDEINYDGSYRLEITPEVGAGKEGEIIGLEGKVACSAG